MAHIFTPFTEKDLLPKEEKLDIAQKGKKTSIGIPKETCLYERRTVITPDAVQVLTNYGFEIILEKGTGIASFFTDLQYSEAGAKITDDPKIAFRQDVVLKINPPTEEEIDLLKKNAYLISALQINLRNDLYFKKLAEKKINAIAFELIKDEYNQLALVRLIGEIAGSVSILYASEILALSNGLMLGGVTGVRPTKIVIIGAGIVGEFATKSAIGLGAHVKVFDNSLYKLRRLHSEIDRRISTSIIDPKELKKSLRRADVVIGATSQWNQLPIVNEEMIKMMKKGSVIIDLGIDSSQVFETSEVTSMEKPYFIKHDIVHCGIPNITSKTPRTTTKAISNFFLSHFIHHQFNGNLEELFIQYQGFKDSHYLYKGHHTNLPICKRFHFNYHDINLLTF